MLFEVDSTFTRALPKVELHAHLSGSISKNCLHSIWRRRREDGECLDIDDPLVAIPSGGDTIDISSFFVIFDRYIYNLVNDETSVRYAVEHVIINFLRDGVAYLELRTTPRENIATGMSMEAYVSAVASMICFCNRTYGDDNRNFDSIHRIEVRLILSIDRKMTAEQAMRVVDMAIKYKDSRNCQTCVGEQQERHIVGVDLCGNPAKGDISVFTPAFRKAKASGLGITVHFAEVPQSSTDTELETLLSWEPDRLGHVINVSDRIKKMIEDRSLGLELCLSCNVLAKLTTGGFADHHFNEWRKTQCPIALSTDDVGIFDSPLSNECLIAAENFHLDRKTLCDLSRGAAGIAFGGRQRMCRLLAEFETQHTIE